MPSDDAQPCVRRDWLTRTPRWALLVGFWLVQGVVLYLLQAFLYVSQGAVEGDSDQTTDRFWGQWPSWDDYTDILAEDEYAIAMLITIGVLSVAQLLFILPVRKPGLTSGKGKGLKTSLFTAGLIIGILTLAAYFGIGEFLREIHEIDIDLSANTTFMGNYAPMVLIVVLGWAVATPLLICFAKPGRRETVLGRLAQKLFIGTILEVALLIPLDVMIRRKTSCYCWAGSYWALTICGFVGVFALGPAVLLPVLAKRRKTWYGGHCGVCGYDMAGMPEAPRCPECGTGWKISPAPTTSPNPNQAED